MTIKEAIDNVKKDGHWTEENIKILHEAVDSTDYDSFEDPKLREFINFINEEPYDKGVQSIVASIVIKLMDKGVQSPCVSGCNPSCAFHEMEFGKQ